jgi:hypothetical protein
MRTDGCPLRRLDPEEEGTQAGMHPLTMDPQHGTRHLTIAREDVGVGSAYQIVRWVPSVLNGA